MWLVTTGGKIETLTGLKDENLEINTMITI